MTLNVATVPQDTAPLKLLAAEVVEPAVVELAVRFETASGRKVTAEYGFGIAQARRVRDGEPVDVFVAANRLIEHAETLAMLAPSSVRFLVRIGQGVAVRRGAARPDITSRQEFKEALLAAKSVALCPAGLSGVTTLATFETLGIADAMKPKIVALAMEEVVPQLAAGAAELALFLDSYLIGCAEVDYLGPYPAGLPSDVAFSAGVGVNARDAQGAAAFVAFISSPAAASVYRKCGMQPG